MTGFRSRRLQLDHERMDFLLRVKLHHDKLFWGRIQTLYVVQAALLGDLYALRTQWYGFALLLFGAVLTLGLALLACYDYQDAKSTNGRLFELTRKYLVHVSALPSGVRARIPGNRLLLITVLLLVSADWFLAWHYFWWPYAQQAQFDVTRIDDFRFATAVAGLTPWLWTIDRLWHYWGQPAVEPNKSQEPSDL